MFEQAYVFDALAPSVWRRPTGTATSSDNEGISFRDGHTKASALRIAPARFLGAPMGTARVASNLLDIERPVASPIGASFANNLLRRFLRRANAAAEECDYARDNHP